MRSMRKRTAARGTLYRQASNPVFRHFFTHTFAPPKHPGWSRPLPYSRIAHIGARDCDRFCAQALPGLSCMGEYESERKPLYFQSILIRASVCRSVQVVDSWCGQSLGAGGRRFKSYRPDQFSTLSAVSSVASRSPLLLRGAISQEFQPRC